MGIKTRIATNQPKEVTVEIRSTSDTIRYNAGSSTAITDLCDNGREYAMRVLRAAVKRGDSDAWLAGYRHGMHVCYITSIGGEPTPW